MSGDDLDSVSQMFDDRAKQCGTKRWVVFYAYQPVVTPAVRATRKKRAVPAHVEYVYLSARGPLELVDQDIYQQQIAFEQSFGATSVKVYRLVYSPAQGTWIWDMRDLDPLLACAPIPGFSAVAGRGGGGGHGGGHGGHHGGHGRGRRGRGGVGPWGWGGWAGCPWWDERCDDDGPLLDARHHISGSYATAAMSQAVLRGYHDGRASRGLPPVSLERFGARRLEPSLRGKWPHEGFPPVVKLAGSPFRKAEWFWPRPGVRAQYREAVAKNSRHLFVMTDGTWVVPHVDAENPDLGSPMRHLLEDVLRRPVPMV